MAIDPQGRSFSKKQVFTLVAPDEEGFLYELNRMFRIFADHHGWNRKYKLIEGPTTKPLRL